MVAKRRAPFKPKYGVQLGLRVGERDPNTQEVLTASCLFCQLFGREGKAGAQRRATEKVAVFKPPFRKDSIRHHHTTQHPRRWAEYGALLSDDSKRAFFIAAGATVDLNQEPVTDGARPRKTPRTSISRPAANAARPRAARPVRQSLPCGPAVHWLVNRDIVAVLIGIMLPYAAEEMADDDRYQEHAVADFDDTMDASESRSDATNGALSRYRIVLSDPALFQQFADYLSTCGSLEQTARMLRASAEPVVVGPFFDDDRHVPSVNVARYARYLCAINFQRLADVTSKAWACSIGLKVVPMAPAAFFDAHVEYCLHVQLRVFVNGEVATFHLLSIPLSRRRPSDAASSTGVFEIAEMALNAVVPRWRGMMLAVVSDSGGAISCGSDEPQLSLRNAVATRFERAAKFGFLRVCSAARQLDSLLQTFVSKLQGGDEFYSNLTTLVAYLMRQRELLADMNTSVPRVEDSRWASMANAAIWFRRHGVSIQEHLAKEQPSCVPPSTWWVRITLMARIAQVAMPVLEEISGLTTRASQPRGVILKLREFMTKWFNVSEPLEHGCSRSGSDDAVTSKDGKYSVKTDDVVGALEDLGSFVVEALQPSENEANQPVITATVTEVADGVVDLVSGLNSIADEIDGAYDTTSELPAVLPHELVKLRGRQFAVVIRSHMQRLQAADWSKQEVDWIEQDFQDLCDAYFREPSLKLALDACKNQTSFREGWSCLQGRFTHLQRFCGALATAYPTAISSSSTGAARAGDAGALAPSQSVNRLPGDLEAGVSDLSVQAALQATQFRHLQAV
ncbi:hypothetical protein BBJ28_00000596 [Nothophytophthora sp. Chile5]|nr:hypothetical protein BBJ28_00000596 [Nothophytophthora sp. Chile5]